MYTLYGDLRSGSTAVELALAELGVPYKFTQVSLSSSSQRDPEYANLNPQRKVPALECSDGNIITESVAIILWLLETHSGHNLLPAIGSAKRSQALRWLIFIAAEIYPIVEIYDYPERFSAESGNPEAVRNIAEKIWRQRWLIVEENIASPFLLESGFCVTDLYIAVVSRWAHQEKWRPANIPKVEALTQAVSNRQLCKKVWGRNFPDWQK